MKEADWKKMRKWACDLRCQWNEVFLVQINKNVEVIKGNGCKKLLEILNHGLKTRANYQIDLFEVWFTGTIFKNHPELTSYSERPDKINLLRHFSLLFINLKRINEFIFQPQLFKTFVSIYWTINLFMKWVCLNIYDNFVLIRFHLKNDSYQETK